MNADYKVDLLVLGMGAAAQLAAIYAHDADPDLNILIATKALKGKGGCSRMVQGGFNVVLDPGDSHEKHLMDTLKGGQYINDQDLALALVEQATPTVKELETVCGCFFDRRPDGHIHQKAFAGQCFDRTVHKGDLTGIEIISRTTEQIFKRRIPVLEETRAVELLLQYKAALEQGLSARTVELEKEDRKLVADLNLLTDKPVLYVCNVDEKSAATGNAYTEAVRAAIAGEKAEMLVIAAATEADIAELESYEERQMFLEDLGLEESGVARLIKSAYKLLNLETFFTTGADETRAWTYLRGMKAPQTAGIIHTDFEKGFIRAEVIKYDDYTALGSEKACRDAGKLSIEGKEYVVEDGDIMHFLFNV